MQARKIADGTCPSDIHAVVRANSMACFYGELLEEKLTYGTTNRLF